MNSETDILYGKILIVDDLEFNINLLKRMLKNAGYLSVESTMNPQDVCDLQIKNGYDLILLDIDMPIMNGFEVMAQLNSIASDDHPPVLVIAAESEHKIRALQSGAKDFVSKPFELVEVMTRVHNLLKTRILEQRLEDHRDDNPALSSIIQRNIRKIIRVRLKAKNAQNIQERVAHRITIFSGSMVFMYLHLIWFFVWILINVGGLGVKVFDPFPFGLLSMIVSLEAIFLTTFVLISQNILGKEAERLTDLGLHTALFTEHELTRVLQMMHAIQMKLGITNDHDSDIADADLEMETNPDDVLTEIARLELREKNQAHHRRKPK